MSWPAELRVRPDVTDAGPLLDRAVSVLRQHPNLLDAGYRYDRYDHVVTFWLHVRYGLHPTHMARYAEDALYESLRAAGLDVGSRALVGPNVPAILRLIGGWPDEFL